MFKKFALPLAVVLLAATGPVLAGDPSADQIYQAAQAGRMGEAQQMIGEVLHDHPNSAKAHFIAAELDARVGDLASARAQLQQARQLDPAQRFASAYAVNELTAQLSGQRGYAAPQAFAPQALVPQRRSAFPWGFVLAVGLGLAVLWAILRARTASYAQPQVLPPAGPGQYGQGYGPGYGPGPGYPPGYPSMGGSGLMGSLGSGLAIGAGVAAGEALVSRMIDGPGSGGYVPPAADLRDDVAPPSNSDMGGNDFGVSDPGSWDSGGGGGDLGGGDFGGGGGDGGDWS
ncbi:MAG TPA: hypothetical protein VMB48_16460 [Steroidobacteraceae bacterium]|nr:hypothetical protein [Steroidobacteraceae bacterium]